MSTDGTYTMLPTQDCKVGDTIQNGDQSFTVSELYSNGKAARQSGKKYFMHVSKGVYGLDEVGGS